MWFAWKIVLLQYHKQLIIYVKFIYPVVICLKNRTFAVSQTTVGWKTTKVQSLWFAWKIVLLQYHKQLDIAIIDDPVSCDLLEKSYFCSITNNVPHSQQHIPLLWFAWKIVLLQYHKQPQGYPEKLDLVVICLKNRTFAVSQTTFLNTSAAFIRLWFAWKIVLLQYHKQLLFSERLLTEVVICLKNRTFAVSQTTIFIQGRPIVRCDLLEKSYFCSITNNF